MLRFLFPRLTAAPSRGTELFAAVTHEARQRHWYVEGEVADTLDGRFAVLATVTALVLVRLEEDDDSARAASVGLTERFVEIMEAEHRELGLGDPGLGRKIRRLVSALARRVELWRPALAGGNFTDAARQSLGLDGLSDEAIAHCGDRLRALWQRLRGRPLADIAEGRLG
jgi:cytochrome b pre-mRNA-processing protein 3